MSGGKFVKNFIVLFSGNTLSQLVPFLFAPVIARLFLQEEIGVFGNLVAITSMIVVVSGGRFENAIVLPKEEKESKILFNLSFRLILTISLFSLGLFVFKDEISSVYKDDLISKYIQWVPLGVFFMGINGLFVQWLLREKKYLKISISKVVLTLCLNLTQLVLGYLSFGVLGLILGWITGWAVSVAVFFFFNKMPFDFKLQIESMKTVAIQYKEFPQINALHAFSDIFFSQVVLLGLITNSYGVAITGVFLMMDKYLRAPVRLVGSSVGQLYYKEAAQLKNENKSPVAIFNRTLRISGLFAIPFLIAILSYGPEIYEWYLTSKFRQSGELAQIMAIPLAMNLLVSPLSSTPLIYKEQKKAFVISLLGYALSIGCLLYAIKSGESLTVAVKFYAVGMFFYYLILLIWYRYLIRNRA